jgi:hypothetical protein
MTEEIVILSFALRRRRHLRSFVSQREPQGNLGANAILGSKSFIIRNAYDTCTQ